jgi:hypothetical protein
VCQNPLTLAPLPLYPLFRGRNFASLLKQGLNAGGQVKGRHENLSPEQEVCCRYSIHYTDYYPGRPAMGFCAVLLATWTAQRGMLRRSSIGLATTGRLCRILGRNGDQ